MGKFVCNECGLLEIEICLPAFFDANGDLTEIISVDSDAEALTYYCRFCENTVAIRDDAGRVHYGRWQTNQELS